VSTLELGSELAGYRIEALVGRGGMGIVYRGTDLRLHRPVAIKLIAADRASDARARRRFEREARLMAAIDHPNVLPVYAAGEEQGSLFLVMRYVAGTDLGALLRAEGRLDPRRAARITEQVAAALDAAHAAGLVHRDIKPANVLLAQDHTYLSDFGIGQALDGSTHLTDSNEWLGTVDFCSPEQLRGDPVDGRGDVYSLGCLLHTALTGTPPHHRDTAPATMLAHLHDDPPPPSLRDPKLASFDELLARALAKRPADRFATAGELGRAASAAAGAGPVRRASGRAGSAGAGSPARATRVRPVPPSRSRRGPSGLTATKLDLRPTPGSEPPGADRGRRAKPHLGRRGALLAGAAALLVAVATALVLVMAPAASPTGPLSRTEITGVVQSFATAYGQRDARALGLLMAPNVERFSPSATEIGRTAVLAEYRGQLRDRSIMAYRVAGLSVETGWVGRAAAQYAVVRAGQSTETGSVTFGIERVGGRPVIELIATQPPG
jgi:serine/threonine-protein kinase